MAQVSDAIVGMSGGKGKLLIFAGICVGAGILLNAGDYFGAEPTGADAEKPALLRADWGESSPLSEEASARAHTWGDAAIRFGGSFMVAMVIGSLLRTFVQAMAVALVVAGGVSWFLCEKGVVEPFWEDALLSWDHAKQWLVGQTDSARDFLQGYVPSMTSALLGFGFGLRK